MLKGFRDFVLRGNVIDLAVGVIIGAAFGAVVTSLVENILTPIIGTIGGNPAFSTVMLGPLKIGLFINSVISFLLIAFALYFFIVVPMNRLMSSLKKEEAVAPPAPTMDQKLLTEIRDLLAKQ